jgi:[ribosomal protein S5]-alanine N-acetyltransferase
MEFDLGHFRLRAWRHGDEQSLAHHANNPKIYRNVRDRFPHPYTLADAEHWIAIANADTPLANFAIEVDGAAVGGIGLMLKEDVMRKSVEIGYWLGEEYWGRHIMTAAVRVVSDYAFATFDICRIFANVFEWNPASMRVLEKAGYEFEARLRKSVIKEGQIIDEMVYAMIRL